MVRLPLTRLFLMLYAFTPLSASACGSSATPSPTMAGVMTTVSGLVFAGDHQGNFMAFEASTGENLWHYQTGSRIWGAAPMTHLLDGRQYVLIPSGTTLVAFALPEEHP